MLIFILLTAVIGFFVLWKIQHILLNHNQPILPIPEQLHLVRNTFLTIIGVVLVIALFIGLLLANKIMLPIIQMRRVCEAMNEGRYNEKVTYISKDEIGLLGQTLNRLGEEITKKVATISTERTQLKTMFAGMIEGIIAVDNRGKIQFCNNATYQLLGSSIHDCRGMTLSEADGFGVLTDICGDAKQKMEFVQNEIIIGSDENERVLTAHASPFASKETSGVILVLHDVTRIRRLERIRRDFIANVSHEIKTPLTAIKGYTETLLNGAIDDRQNLRKFIEKVNTNTNRMVALVQDFLSLARIESDESKVLHKPTSWVPIVKQILLQYEDQFREKKLHVEFQQDEDNVFVMGDKESMFQVLDNLITNAIRYSAAGGRITIQLRKKGALGVLAVEDTGIGIPKKDLSRIFERFYRVDKARSRELGGTGLGLSIVKHLVQGMHGNVGVDSEMGVGTRFKVRLHLAPQHS